MNVYKIAFLLLGALVLSACGKSKAVQAPPAPLTEYPMQIQVSERDSLSMGSGDGDMYLRFQPAIVQGESPQVFTADYKSTVTAATVNNDLKRVWKTRPEEAAVTSGVGAGSGLVLVGTQKGEVIALSQNDGEELWRSQLSSEVLSAPQSADDIVVVLTDDSRVFGIDARSGEILWRHQNNAPLLQLRGSAPLLIQGQTVYVGFANGFVSALNLHSGKLLWQQAVSFPRGRSEIDRVVDVNGQMAIDQGILYVVNYQGRAIAFDARSPRLLWEREFSSYQGLAVNSQAVFITDEESRVWSLEKRNGDTLWQQTELMHRELTAPVVYKNTIVIGDFEGYLHFMDTNNGQLIGRVSVVNHPIHTPPVVVGDDLFVLSSKGLLTRLSITPTL